MFPTVRLLRCLKKVGKKKYKNRTRSHRKTHKKRRQNKRAQKKRTQKKRTQKKRTQKKKTHKKRRQNKRTLSYVLLFCYVIYEESTIRREHRRGSNWLCPVIRLNCGLQELGTTVPYQVILYHIKSYHTKSYYTILQHTIQYHTQSYHTIPYQLWPAGGGQGRSHSLPTKREPSCSYRARAFQNTEHNKNTI